MSKYSYNKYGIRFVRCAECGVLQFEDESSFLSYKKYLEDHGEHPFETGPTAHIEKITLSEAVSLISAGTLSGRPYCNYCYNHEAPQVSEYQTPRHRSDTEESYPLNQWHEDSMRRWEEQDSGKSWVRSIKSLRMKYRRKSVTQDGLFSALRDSESDPSTLEDYLRSSGVHDADIDYYASQIRKLQSYDAIYPMIAKINMEISPRTRRDDVDRWVRNLLLELEGILEREGMSLLEEDEDGNLVSLSFMEQSLLVNRLMQRVEGNTPPSLYDSIWQKIMDKLESQERLLRRIYETHGRLVR